MIPVKFSVADSDADVSKPRRDAQRIAGQVLRACAHAIQSCSGHDIVIRVPVHPQDAAITGASMLILAQQIDPVKPRASPRWDRKPADIHRHTSDTAVGDATTDAGRRPASSEANQPEERNRQ
ncbi:hypothetical protein [Bifidobacterium simiiventris]|uniref:hypothetical protein n=1 Tax=Bifidobacterium simiiventris TaxID=2834434 RepID=UPI001C5978E9|nr:hypothetical protein [Bifidobacterium simiiventris]MBW3078227.1 hypothetical protein [Bifidobacterium simiiventris]